MCKTNFHFATNFTVQILSCLDSVTIVSGNYYLTFIEWSYYCFKTFYVILCSSFERFHNRILNFMLVSQFGFFNDVCTSDKFGTKFEIFSFCDFNFVFCSLNWSFQIILNCWDDVDFIFVVFFLHLLSHAFDSQLNIWLFSIN